MQLTLETHLEQKILVLDGALGTVLSTYSLDLKDYGDAQYEGCGEILNRTRPDIIQEIHESYIIAGADIITTNTFGANRIVLKEYGLEHETTSLNYEAVSCVQRAIHRLKPKRKVYIAGNMGPSSKSFSVTGGITLEEIEACYFEQALALVEAECDVLLLETIQDTLNAKAAIRGIHRAFKTLKKEVPLMISCTIESTKTMLSGQTIDAFYASIAHTHPISVGLNCALGPKDLYEEVECLSKYATTFVSLHPNAGLPNEDGFYDVSPKAFLEELRPMIDRGFLNIVGGCCGTTPEHIREIVNYVQNKGVTLPQKQAPQLLSGLKALELEEASLQKNVYIVGERTNTIGSKIFRTLIEEEKFAEAVEIAKRQVQAGAEILDICLANPDRAEIQDMLSYISEVRNSIKIPLMIDTTNTDVLRNVLPHIPGRSILNSINLERGNAYFEEFISIAREHGSMIIIGLIDENGMARTFEEKKTVLDRTLELLKYLEYPLDYVIIDPLIFPVATGDETYYNALKNTRQMISYIRKEHPSLRSVLGLSNVSFGLPLSGRELINQKFLEKSLDDGLNFALVNPEKIFTKYEDLTAIKHAQNLLEDNTMEHVEAFVTYVRSQKKKPAATNSKKETLTDEEELAKRVLEGSKYNVETLLENIKSKGMTPLEIINGPLMKGMDEVGIRFGKNQMIVTEVLQSAAVMKHAVGYLEQYMDSSTTQKHGHVLLATVKGDVHDIGKNLVHIIFENNGYEVTDLGINVSTQTLVSEILSKKPDIIGLSGLLVKSALQMVQVVEEFKLQGITTPLLLGGAALTDQFVATRVAPQAIAPVFYCKDAMVGLAITNDMLHGNCNDRLKKNEEHQEKLREFTKTKAIKKEKRKNFSKDIFVPVTPYKGLEDMSCDEVRVEVTLQDIFEYISPKMLYQHHLGIRGNLSNLSENEHIRFLHLQKRVQEFLATYGEKHKLSGIYRIVRTKKKMIDETLMNEVIQLPDHQVEFSFPRQNDQKGRSLSDYLNEDDYIGLMIVTAGSFLQETSKKLQQLDDFEGAHIINVLNLEAAEGMAEYVHQCIRKQMKIENDSYTMEEIRQAKYQGKRYSFGYAACPDLSDQKKIFEILQPERIPIRLTDEYMMEPEASITAVCFAHPECTYYSVGMDM